MDYYCFVEWEQVESDCMPKLPEGTPFLLLAGSPEISSWALYECDLPDDFKLDKTKIVKRKNVEVSHIQITNLFPFPKNLGEILYSFDKVLVPELNCGQLLSILRDKFMIPAIGLNKVKGLPFSTTEVLAKIEELSK